MFKLRPQVVLSLALLGSPLGGRADEPVSLDAQAAAVFVRNSAAATRALPIAEAEPSIIPVAEQPKPACAERIHSALLGPNAPGTPLLDAARAKVLLYAKAEPVQFTRRPNVEPHTSAAGRSYRSMLERGHSPWSVLQRLLPVFAANNDLARSVLLREGYLYAEDPILAFALVDLVSVQLLFNEPEVWIERGERRLVARRTNRGYYVYADGPEQGQRARLLLFDRIGVGATTPSLHHDFRALRQRVGFDAAKVVHESGQTLVVDLRYGQQWVRSLLQADGPHLDLSCENELGPAAGERRAQALERTRLLEPLRQAMRAQVEDGLPFDEPRTEYGQQDGVLRRAWLRAYQANQLSYELNDDRYYVFNSRGQPLVPQVCIDFIFDTFARAGGSWWTGRKLARQRTPGKFDLESQTQLDLRRANSIVELATARPDWLELLPMAESERVPFKNSPQLSRYLTDHADDFAPGDVVLIRGYAPWDKPWKPRVMHMHSFFVYESDPMTGMPSVLAGNPGQPVLQTWQFEAFRTPERSIFYRVRPRLSWLRQLVTAAPAVPPPPAISVDARDFRMPIDIPTPGGVAPGDQPSTEPPSLPPTDQPSAPPPGVPLAAQISTQPPDLPLSAQTSTQPPDVSLSAPTSTSATPSL